MNKIIFFLTALLVSMMSFAADYAKITITPEDWSGEYLLVYEDKTSAHVWTGIDANSCCVSATSEEGIISGNDFVTITIAPMEGGYSILTNGGDNNGKYICGQADNNKLLFKDEARCGQSVRLAREYVPRYTVTTSDNTDSNEPLTTGAGEYKEGTEVTVNAETAIEGWTFYCWTQNDSVVSYNAEYTFIVEADIALVAIYALEMEATVTDMIFNQQTSTITGTAQLPTGTLQANLILGEGFSPMFYLAENSTLTFINGEDTQELTFIEGMAIILMDNYVIAMVMVEWDNTLVMLTLNMTNTGDTTSVDNITTNTAPQKIVENGQVFIIRNGVKYNTQGAIVK